MSFELEIDHDHRVVLTRLMGSMTLPDLLAYLDRIEELPGYDATYSRLTDARQLTRLPTMSEVQTIAYRIRSTLGEDNPMRIAYLVRSGVSFGVARMIQQFANANRERAAVFSDENAARAWVGLPPLSSTE